MVYRALPSQRVVLYTCTNVVCTYTQFESVPMFLVTVSVLCIYILCLLVYLKHCVCFIHFWLGCFIFRMCMRVVMLISKHDTAVFVPPLPCSNY